MTRFWPAVRLHVQSRYWSFRSVVYVFLSGVPVSRGRGWITPLEGSRQNRPVTDIAQAASEISLVGMRLQAYWTYCARVNTDNRGAPDVR